MAIVKVYNKARDITYVYESVSYWDKELKQPRSHRKLIGKIDPSTGDIVPTSTRTRNPESVHSDMYYKNLYEHATATIEQKDAAISELRNKLLALEKENKAYHRSIIQASKILMGPVSEKGQDNNRTINSVDISTGLEQP